MDESKEVIHRIELGEGNVTICGKAFTMTDEGWELKFAVQKDKVTCNKCLENEK